MRQVIQFIEQYNYVSYLIIYIHTQKEKIKRKELIIKDNPK